ncbi:MAG TPA: PQQ-binding-like beta-propeller repeat protein [Gemmataceae bacterium]|nr:PQQ-binding-like beta-propeller repeat protein [Gemmataceae bacterium]
MRIVFSSCLLVLLAAAVVGAPAPTQSASFDWPQWRGPNNDGISKETGLPTEWGTSNNIAWTLELPGRGGSTPAVWRDRLFLTSEDGKDIVLMCVSTGGKELWKRTFGPIKGRSRFMGAEGDNASPSPSTDGKHVWAFAGTGDLACFDVDGKEVWKFNMQDRYGKYEAQHGLHNTPLLDGDRLYLEYFIRKTAYVVALDKASGKEVWKVERKSDGYGENLDSYTSPVIWRKGKDAYLITHGNDYAIAHRLDNGEEIWRVGGLNPKDKYRADLRFVSSPVATPDLIVIPSAKEHGVVGLKPDATGLVMPGSDSEAWRLVKGTPDVASPLVYDGLVYLCKDGTLVCLDAKTGKEQYSQRIHANRYRASPVAADGNIYLTAHDATVTVVKAGPEFKEVAVNKLPDEMTASPAPSNGRIYLRGWKKLYAIGAPAK